MTLTKLKKTVVLVFAKDEFKQLCESVQAVTSLDNLREYIGDRGADVLYSIEEKVIDQLKEAK